MSRINELGEKDQLIKVLRNKIDKTDSKTIKVALETKLNVIEKNKTVNKWI